MIAYKYVKPYFLVKENKISRFEDIKNFNNPENPDNSEKQIL